MIKRMFDLSFSIAGLMLMSPVFVLIAILIKLDSTGPIFYRQERVGRNFRTFHIFKFRTMVSEADSKGPLVTVEGDQRITRVGRFLRRSKLDEFPQLINVLRGEMSLVGPRPEVRHYVEMFHSDYEELLRLRPGMTDPASLAFINEEEVLASSKDWETDYVNNILPEKIRLAKTYAKSHNLMKDLGLILKTVFRK